jgi:hypothetical protein
MASPVITWGDEDHPMKMVVGSDHSGFPMKAELLALVA